MGSLMNIIQDMTEAPSKSQNFTEGKLMQKLEDVEKVIKRVYDHSEDRCIEEWFKKKLDEMRNMWKVLCTFCTSAQDAAMGSLTLPRLGFLGFDRTGGGPKCPHPLIFLKMMVWPPDLA